ncbi:hypothetical protein WJX72_009919 [[Myrmecia] bisecta]|uniref:Ankyrin repeat protein n=1 Tax=[Myrmecia] bisecta TaxID=41462 RepID=A0AAW1PT43_9CHLO
MDQATALRTLSHLFDTTGAGLPPAEPPGPTPSSVAPYAGYNSSFGRPACSCSRCLKRAGPVTDNAGDTIDDIAQYLEDNVFNDETDEAFPPGHFSEPAEELVRLVERGDANSLRPLLDEFTEDVQAELATMLAILAAQHGHANIIHLLGEYGADFEDCDETRGGPPLMHAANNGHAAAVTALIKNGANPDSVDWDSNTALMVAIFSDRSSAAEALLEGGADPEAEDEKGRTALSHAARYGSIDCIHVLAQFNANVFHKDHDDRTPVEIAEDSARTEATAILKRLQQRQRLRERRDAKARSGPKQPESVNPVEQARRAEEARLAAEALLAEEAASKAAQAEAKAAKKAKQKKAKHKAVAEDHAADAASQHMNAAAEAADEAKKLRQQWDDVLHEAACCFDKDRQQELLEVIIEMSPRVVEAGISTKYGKKVVGKLEKVGPVRAELWEALTCDPPDRPRLQKAVEKASSLRSLVDPALLADADALVAKLLQEEEHNNAEVEKQSGMCPICRARIEYTLQIIN